MSKEDSQAEIGVCDRIPTTTWATCVSRLAVEVEESAHVHGMGVNALKVAVEDGEEVVHVAPLGASRAVVGIIKRNAPIPSVVVAHGLCDVAVELINDASEELRSKHDVVLRAVVNELRQTKGVEYILQVRSSHLGTSRG